MNELQIFKNNTFGNVRVLEQGGEPWFVAKDVCDCLGLKNPTMAVNTLDDDERAKFNLGRQGNTNIVNEYGLYNLVLSSRKPEAKEFKRWITHEVIPSIRKYGSFNMAIPRTLPDALTAYAHEIEAHQKTQALLEAQRPKVLFADSVAASHTSILIGELAKLLHQNGVKDMGQKRLFAWMREHGYLISRKANDYNMPTQRAMELGLFQIKETTVTHSDGHISVSKTPKVTGKGQQYFIEKFLGRR